MPGPSPLDALCQTLVLTLDRRGRVQVPGLGTFTGRPGRGRSVRFRSDARLQQAVDARQWRGGEPALGLQVPGLDPAQLGELLDRLVRVLAETSDTVELPGLGTLMVRRVPHRRVENNGGVVCIPGQNHIRFQAAIGVTS